MSYEWRPRPLPEGTKGTTAFARALLGLGASLIGSSPPRRASPMNEGQWGSVGLLWGF